MILAVQGSHKFEDYNIFLRSMLTGLGTMQDDDKEIYIYSAGPYRLNSMAQEFANVSENSLRARGIKIQVRKVNHRWLKDNMKFVSYFAFFSKPGEPISDLVSLADELKIEAQVYTFR